MIQTENLNLVYEQWEKAANASNFERIYPKAEQCWNSSADTYDLGMGCSLERVDVVMKELQRLGYTRENLRSALDIGSGTGNYTIPLAGIVQHVTALDCAHKMNVHLCEKLRENGITNVSVIEADFMKQEFEGNYDLVLGSMNPVLYHPEAFEKMISITGKILIYVGIIPEKGQQKKHEKASMEERLFGFRSTHGGSNDVRYPFAMLREKGYHPYILEADCSWRYAEPAEQVFFRLKEQYRHTPVPNMQLERQIKLYIEEHETEKGIVTEGNFRAGILMCEMRKDI